MSFSPARALAQSLQYRFANETPHQRARHYEIARRYRHRPRNTFAKIVNLRKVEITMLTNSRHFRLPDDHEGRRMLRIMADHLAQLGPDHVRRWANQYAPWMGECELADLIEEVGPGKRWSATALGKALRLTNKERTRLGIKTIRPIDRTAAQLEQDCKNRDVERKRRRRAETGATPRSQSMEQTKPWRALGISRATGDPELDAAPAVIAALPPEFTAAAPPMPADNAMQRALEAQRKAEELQRAGTMQPAAAANADVDRAADRRRAVL